MRSRYSSSALLLAVSIFVLTPSASAQPQTPQLPTPPPMRFVPRDDRSQLTAAKDAKMRVSLSLELANARLTRIEELTSKRQFERASEALGNYLGLIEDAKHFIGSLIQDKNSTRDLYRRLDIALRAHIPRLAVARRATPNDYAIHLKAGEEFARTTRSDVLESFYGNTVLRDTGADNKAGDNKSTPQQENKRP
jgi:hypothetical protein